MKQWFVWASASVLSVGLAATSLAADTSPISSSVTANTITVNGQGIVYATPDTIDLNMFISRQDQSPEAAYGDVQAIAAKVQKSLAALGITPDHVQIQNINLWSNGAYSFTANANLNVEVPSIKIVGRVMELAIKNGVTNLGGLQFSLANSSAEEREALSKALAQARSRAEVLARALGVTLGRVEAVQEQVNVGAGGPLPVSPEPIKLPPSQTGGVQVVVQVTVTYTYH